MSKTQRSSPHAKRSTTEQAAKLQALRAERILDYLQSALTQHDPLLANLGAVHSDLLQIERKLKQALDRALSDATRDVLDFEVLLPGLDHLLRLAKQIDRFTQLEIQLKGAARKSTVPQRAATEPQDTPAVAAEGSSPSEESSF